MPFYKFPTGRLLSSLCSSSSNSSGNSFPIPKNSAEPPPEFWVGPLPGQAQRHISVPHHVSILLSHPERPNVHYILSNPHAILVANRPKSTGPAHRLLPFFMGTFVGALSLAAWESNASAQQYPYQQPQPQHPQSVASSSNSSSLQNPQLLLHPSHAPPRAAALPPPLCTSMPHNSISPSISSSSIPPSSSSSSSQHGLSKSLGLGLGSLSSSLGPAISDGYKRWWGLWPSEGAKPSQAEALCRPPSPPLSVPLDLPSGTHTPSDPDSPFPPPLPPPTSPRPTPAYTAASPYPAAALSPSSSSSSGGSMGEQPQAPVPLTRTSISDATARAAPAVVHLMVEGQQQQQQGWGGMVGGMGVVGPGRSSGSGFIYDARGFILTNAHVVEGAAAEEAGGSPGSGVMLGWGHGGSSSSSSSSSSSKSKRGSSVRRSEAGVLTVTLQDGRMLRGKVVCLDRAADVAVVKVDAPDPLPVAPIGDSSKLRVGEWVVALGSPLMLKHSVTAGIVSCVARRGNELGLPGARAAYIQTDVAINQGNSGGPLINLDGEVVGMSMMKAVAADGVSFCLPISSIHDIVSNFSAHGRMRYPYVGVTLVEIGHGAVHHVHAALPELLGAGAVAVVVQSVREGSPAQAAGLQPKDILVDLDGRSYPTMNEVVEHFGAHIHRACALRVLRRVVGPEGSQGPYALLSTHITPSEHQPT